MSTEEVQTRPTPTAPPLPPLALHEVPGVKPADEGRLRNSSLVTKLRILLRCHEVAGRERRRLFLRRLLVLAVGLLVGGGLGTLAGIGVFVGGHEEPRRHVQLYHDGRGHLTYYLRGQQVSQQQYDYYLATRDNEAAAVTGGVAVGLATLFVVVGVFLVVLGRRRRGVPDSVEDQIAAILKGHPEAVNAWGGPSVLREPVLVEELLRIEEAGKR